MSKYTKTRIMNAFLYLLEAAAPYEITEDGIAYLAEFYSYSFEDSIDDMIASYIKHQNSNEN